MKTIKIKNINFDLLEKLPKQGKTSITYKDKNTCYKLFNDLSYMDKKILFHKFNDMENIKIKNVILPDKLIIKNSNMIGYTSNYLENGVSLYTKFSNNSKYLDTHAFLESLIKSSKILKEIHENKIIYQDLNLSNILINENNECYFIDLIESCSYKDYKSPYIPNLTHDFITKYRKNKLVIDENMDKISMLLSFLLIIFKKPIQQVSKSEYKEMKKNINTLNIIENYIDKLLDKNISIPEIPYLDEIIDNSDDYYIKKIETK